MHIEVWKLAPDGETFTGEESEGILDLEPEAFARATGPVHYTLHVQLAGQELLATGRLVCRFEFVCARCAEHFPQEVVVPDFACAVTVEDRFQTVHLTEDIRESILLALPSYAVCAPTCRGLCPTCGANLNATACRCGRKPDAGPWNALDKLKVD